MYVCMHACMHACMHVCMYVCMCVHVCIYIYAYVTCLVADWLFISMFISFLCNREQKDCSINCLQLLQIFIYMHVFFLLPVELVLYGCLSSFA